MFSYGFEKNNYKLWISVEVTALLQIYWYSYEIKDLEPTLVGRRSFELTEPKVPKLIFKGWLLRDLNRVVGGWMSHQIPILSTSHSFAITNCTTVDRLKGDHREFIPYNTGHMLCTGFYTILYMIYQ